MSWKGISTIQVLNGIAAYQSGQIEFKDLRVYLACAELVAIREAAMRGRGDKKLLASYECSELEKLTGVKNAKASLKRLNRAGLGTFEDNLIKLTETPLPCAQELLKAFNGGRSDKRRLPVPRSLLRYLVSQTRPTYLLVILAHCIYALSFNRQTKDLKNAGRIKASFIAEVFGISERSVHAARAKMLEVGILDSDVDNSNQHLLNNGLYFRINLDFGAGENTKFSAPPAQNEGKFSGLYKDLKTSTKTKTQKLPAGSVVPKRPNLKKLQPGDITNISKLRELFKQAVSMKILLDSEANWRQFVAAAYRAKRANNPEGMFIFTIRNGFSTVAACDEEAAQKRLKRLHQQSRRGTVETTKQANPVDQLIAQVLNKAA